MRDGLDRLGLRLRTALETRNLKRRLLLEHFLPVELLHLLVVTELFGRHVSGLPSRQLLFARVLRDAEIVEEMEITPDQVTLVRHGPRGKRQDWQANPHWVRLTLHASSGPVPNYLTLKGDGREVELGAFLSEDERIALRDELSQKLNGLR